METGQPTSIKIDGVAMYTPRSFSESGQIPRQTVYSAIASGVITSRRIGGRLYLLASSADEYIQVYNARKGKS